MPKIGKYNFLFDRKTATAKDVVKLRRFGLTRAYEWRCRKENNFKNCCPNIYYGAMSTALIEIRHQIHELGKTKNAIFLDTGCGDSPDCSIALYCGFKRAVGMDLFPCEKDEKEFLQHDMVEKWPFESRTFDVIISQRAVVK